MVAHRILRFLQDSAAGLNVGEYCQIVYLHCWSPFSALALLLKTVTMTVGWVCGDRVRRNVPTPETNKFRKLRHSNFQHRIRFQRLTKYTVVSINSRTPI